MANQVDAGRINVGLAGRVQNRLHYQIHSGRARAVEMIEIEQRHEDQRIRMCLQFRVDPLRVNLHNAIGIGRRIGQEGIFNRQLHDQRPWPGEVIALGDAQEVADLVGSGLLVDVINAALQRLPVIRRRTNRPTTPGSSPIASIL